MADKTGNNCDDCDDIYIGFVLGIIVSIIIFYLNLLRL